MRENLAKNMNMFYKLRGNSMVDFANELEIARSTLQEYLDGNGNPRMDTLVHLSNKLKVSPGSLVSDLLPGSQTELLESLLKTLDLLSQLNEPQQREFVRLLQAMLSLWNTGDEKAGE